RQIDQLLPLERTTRGSAAPWFRIRNHARWHRGESLHDLAGNSAVENGRNGRDSAVDELPNDRIDQPDVHTTRHGRTLHASTARPRMDDASASTNQREGLVD